MGHFERCADCNSFDLFFEMVVTDLDKVRPRYAAYLRKEYAQRIQQDRFIWFCSDCG